MFQLLAPFQILFICWRSFAMEATDGSTVLGSLWKIPWEPSLVNDPWGWEDTLPLTKVTALLFWALLGRQNLGNSCWRQSWFSRWSRLDGANCLPWSFKNVLSDRQLTKHTSPWAWKSRNEKYARIRAKTKAHIFLEWIWCLTLALQGKRDSGQWKLPKSL